MRQKRSAIISVLTVALISMLALPGGALPQAGVANASDGLSFLTGPNAGAPDDIAVGYVQVQAEDFGVSRGDVADLGITSSFVSAHSGVTHVNVQQRYRDLEVFGSNATVNIAKDGSVIHVGDSLVANLREAVGTSSTGEVDAIEAVEVAADALDLDEPANLEVLERSDEPSQETLLSDGGISDDPIPARLGWQPTDAGLRLAWQLVIDDASDAHLWNATVDARTGKILAVEDWNISHTEEDLAHLDRSGTQVALAGTGMTAQAQASPNTHRSRNPVDDGSSYRVYELPKESPNDGPRTLVTNPADGSASPWGWHDTNGAPGAEFTTARGNNVHAYTDRNNSNSPDPGGQPDGGPGLDFDFPVDLTQSPLTYGAAAVTNLFYMNNIIHDVLYGYGFTEPAGNFQTNNYGRGGVGGDAVRAEAQDGGGVNNANFSTPAQDGGAPRMQMYLWNPSGGVLPNQVTVDAPSPAAGTYGATGAAFGPPLGSTAIPGSLEVANDGSAVPAEGCAPFIGFTPGAVAIVDRGTCPFADKVLNAQNAGAVAVIVANNAPGAPITLGGAGPLITIPAVMVTQADGTTIKAGLPASGSMRANPAAVQRDGDFENGIIIHEYGHGVSFRLTGGPNVNCLAGQEQMGEGWSDYLAIAMLLDPALDNPEGARGMGPYAVFQDSREGAGIRPRPYSRDMEIQPFTYDRIKTGGWLNNSSLAAPHGIGHGWSAILWDLTWDLIDRHGFHDNIYDAWNSGGNTRAIQYVMDGMKMQGCNPGFVNGRDGIIAAANAVGGADTCMIWGAFARRGLGFSAEQGTAANRNDNTEAFDMPSGCRAPGAGFVGPQLANAPALNTRDAGSTAPIFFNVAGNKGLDVLKGNHAPSSQQLDCSTLLPVQYAITTPTDSPGNTTLAYNRQQDRYLYQWKTDEAWAGTCRQLIVTLTDGTQHRANFRFTAATP
jgi:extracellular elastinolytic metalloproteinase